MKNSNLDQFQSFEKLRSSFEGHDQEKEPGALENQQKSLLNKSSEKDISSCEIVYQEEGDVVVNTAQMQISTFDKKKASFG